ncbi:MAG: SIMPL domain-containing protein [Patescibacteria group bacterium]|nr:SIMPL domain-containing protein [Patescibacteria group bacterium]
MNAPAKFWNAATIFVFVLIASAAVCMIAVLKSINYIGTNRNQTNTISVQGTGDALATPDVATFSFTLSDTEKTVAAAQAKVTAAENSALKVVRDAGVADKDIQTASYTINPHYTYQNAICPQPAVYNASSGVSGASSVAYCPPGKQTLTGYDVSETIQIKLRDLSKAGSLLTALGAAGVSNLNGPNFTVDNPDSVQAEARAKAIADAKTKADELAKELGVTIVGVTSFYENNGPMPVYAKMLGAGAAAPESAATPSPSVPSGEQKVTDSVTITYEIR